MKWLNTRWGVVVSVLCVLCSAAYAGCFVSGPQSTCCNKITISCSGSGQYWQCYSNPDEGPFAVQTAVSATMFGMESIQSTVAGTCKRAPVSCSTIPTECNFGNVVTIQCMSSFTYGNGCQAGGGNP